MAEKSKVGAVEVRRVEQTVGETGLGVSDRTDVSYELGAEIDGKFVRFVSVSAAHAESMGARGDILAERDKPQTESGTPSRA